MLRMSMGNRLAVPQADNCHATSDTSANAPPHDESTELERDAKVDQDHEPEPSVLPARNSFEIMSRFNWDMLDTTVCCAFSITY